MRFRAIRPLIIPLSLAYAAAFLLICTGFYAELSNALWDNLVRLNYAVKANPGKLSPVVLLTLDDESYASSGMRWPWDRAVIADILTRASEQGPKALAIDLVFPGVSPNPDSDEKFAAAIERARHVLLSAYSDQKGYFVTSDDLFVKSSAGLGQVNVLDSGDGVIREIPLALENKKSWVYSFGAAAGMLAQKDAVISTQKSKGFPGLILPHGEIEIRSGSKNKKVLTGSNFDIGVQYLARHGDFERVPFSEIMRGGDGVKKLRGKIVLMGAEAAVLHDTHKTPLGMMSGLAIQGNVLVNYLRGGTVRRTQPLYPVLLFILLTLGSAFSYSLRGRYKMILFTFISSLIAASATLILFLEFQIFFDSLFAIVSGLLLSLFFIFRDDGARFLEMMRLKELAARDSLTKLYNFHFFKVLADSFLRKKRPGALLIFDLDDFKGINDTKGHSAGNQVLVFFARAIKASGRERDIAARFGGDEFCILLDGAADEKAAVSFITRLKNYLREHREAVNVEAFTFSAGGVVLKAESGVKFDDWFDSADRALYQSKKKGKNCETIEVFDPASLSKAQPQES